MRWFSTDEGAFSMCNIMEDDYTPPPRHSRVNALPIALRRNASMSAMEEQVRHLFIFGLYYDSLWCWREFLSDDEKHYPWLRPCCPLQRRRNHLAPARDHLVGVLNGLRFMLFAHRSVLEMSYLLPLHFPFVSSLLH